MQKEIILTTLNARYTHTSIGLRYIQANLQEFEKDSKILEFTINENIQSIAERILEYSPKVVGIGVYIWNATEVHELIEVIKKVAPHTVVVLGGPEVSYEPFRVDYARVDYILQGEGDEAFYRLYKRLLSNNFLLNNSYEIIKPIMADLKSIKMPYRHYVQHDIDNRYIYVEASRGCPFLCEFCLSSIDEKVRNFELETLLEEFEILWQKGARNFKFIDRTFNLNMRFANAILDFFLAKEPPYFAHFEVIPDHFPESIKQKIAKFPEGSLQLEIGIQTLNLEIANNISRPLKLDKIKENIAFLEKETKAHMHLDLIVGLPGEDLETFGQNLDELVSWTESEIQIGILKKLSGTTLNRHDIMYEMQYSDIPPYDVLKTSKVSFLEIQKMKRFARFWDIYYNSGNFKKSIKLLWNNERVFKNFYDFSHWIYTQTESTYKISLERQAKLLFEYLIQTNDEKIVALLMLEDLMKIKGRNVPKYLQPYMKEATFTATSEIGNGMKRQAKHS